MYLLQCITGRSGLGCDASNILCVQLSGISFSVVSLGIRFEVSNIHFNIPVIPQVSYQSSAKACMYIMRHCNTKTVEIIYYIIIKSFSEDDSIMTADLFKNDQCQSFIQLCVTKAMECKLQPPCVWSKIERREARIFELGDQT